MADEKKFRADVLVIILLLLVQVVGLYMVGQSAAERGEVLSTEMKALSAQVADLQGQLGGKDKAAPAAMPDAPPPAAEAAKAPPPPEPAAKK